MMTALVLFTLWQPTPQDLAPLLSRSRLVVLDCSTLSLAILVRAAASKR